jgi:hypothetical protein
VVLPVRAIGKPAMKNPPRRCRAGAIIENDHLVPIQFRTVNGRFHAGRDSCAPRFHLGQAAQRHGRRSAAQH